MSDRAPRVSRRRLLQLASLAPLAALAEGGASTAALAETAQACAKIDETVMKELVKKAENYVKPHPLPEAKFRLVVCVLWTNFLAGANPVEVNPTKLLRVLLFAFDKKGKKKKKECGKLILDNLSSWDDCGDEPQTNACAHECGKNAASHATGNPPEIDETSFSLGYDDTEDHMSLLMERLRKRFGDKVGPRGFGC